MRKTATAFLCCLLALCLSGCALWDLLNPPPPEPKPANRAWSLSARSTRTARLVTGNADLVWTCTLDMAFFKRGGDTPEGDYEGQLMLYVETDCYEDGVYTRTPPGLEDNPPARGWLLSAMIDLSVTAADADAARADLDGAAAYDRQARNAMEVDWEPGEALPEHAYGEDEAEGAPAQPLRAALYDCDDYGGPLPAAAPLDARWRTNITSVTWQDGTTDLSWARASAEAAAVAAAGGFEGQPVAESSYAPPFGQFFGGWQSDAEDALPLWVDIAQDGTAQVYLPGLAPLEASRPFEGKVASGNSISANLPAPPLRSEEDDSSLPEEESQPESEPESTSQKPIWPPMPDSGTEGEAENEPPVESEPEEPEPDPLEAALEHYHLPWPPGGTITGPFPDGDADRFVIEGFSYQDAESYARKLKMGGYKSVHSEVAQPNLDRYTFAAQNGVAQHVSISYENGKTELLAFNS